VARAARREGEKEGQGEREGGTGEREGGAGGERGRGRGVGQAPCTCDKINIP